ncbi:hypothetical protein F0365_02350 [Nonlabens sp. Ci31]|jgi:hypothetical protein|uniref:hypothetical protein n=1 Tax=Nonlabens sp. Ci31 TaxID=2608253 RepID=UPI0014644220|nr:hypothetical protein [Nonlabens sp. Ci31]QJP33330.1 hypothetical protein F0365_02350 [Nonlabens sp. Ci31]
MKKIIAICIFIISSNIAVAQDRPATINKLKELIGYKAKEVKNNLKSKKYKYDEDDTDDEGYYHQYFTDKNYDAEIDILYFNNISRGAGFEGISETEYNQLIRWLKENDFYLKTKGDSGIKRQDLWESTNQNWRLIITYNVYPELEPLKIMLYKTK